MVLMLCDKELTEAEYSVHTCMAYLTNQRIEQDKGIWSLRGCIYCITVFTLEMDWQESGGWMEF